MPDEVAERIVDAHCKSGNTTGKTIDGVKITDIHQHNACNHTLSGEVEIDGETLYFIVNSGDWNGFDVLQYGTVDEVGVYEPPKPSRFMFVPIDDNLKKNRSGMYRVYLKWTKEKWFIDKLNGYHYDRHFQPGCFIEKHYSDWAAQKGLKIKCISEE